MTLPRITPAVALLLVTIPLMCTVSSSVDSGRQAKVNQTKNFLRPFSRDARDRSRVPPTFGIVFSSSFNGVSPWTSSSNRSKFAFIPQDVHWINSPRLTPFSRNFNDTEEHRDGTISPPSDGPMTSIPEPSSLPLAGTGLALIVGTRMWRRRFVQRI
ncbi:MAG TPA: PEP-CTERM sorting domain-containing protein [Candidatus Sulfotelmatobacter sp.]